MGEKMKGSWREFRDAEPGKRFIERYERRKKSRGNGLSRFFFVLLGVVVFAAGIFFLPAPGPGTVILLIGAGLIAQEWRAAARAMDWLELRVRAVVSWAIRLWKRSTVPVRALIVLLAIAVGGGVAYGAYRLLLA